MAAHGTRPSLLQRITRALSGTAERERIEQFEQLREDIRLSTRDFLELLKTTEERTRTLEHELGQVRSELGRPRLEPAVSLARPAVSSVTSRVNSTTSRMKSARSGATRRRWGSPWLISASCFAMR